MSREAFTSDACIAGRVLLGWSTGDLATRAGVADLTVEGFESRRRRPRYKTVTALLRAFKGHGVVFVPDSEAPARLSQFDADNLGGNSG